MFFSSKLPTWAHPRRERGRVICLGEWPPIDGGVFCSRLWVARYRIEGTPIWKKNRGPVAVPRGLKDLLP